MQRMDELIPLREWLLARKGQWTHIAKRLQLSTKTIQRVANEPERSVNLRTYMLLRDEMLADARMEHREPAQHEEGA